MAPFSQKLEPPQNPGRFKQSEPPFAETGEKKTEFPDAVALSTLEGWANANDTRVLAVAQDKDWQRYGEQSDRVVVVDDLAVALAAMQRWVAAADPSVRLAAEFAAGDAIGLRAAILAAAQDQLDRINFRVEGDSQFYVDDYELEAAVESVNLDIPDATGDSLDTVSHNEAEAVIKVGGTASVSLNVRFYLQTWDSSDREYMDMGTANLPHTTEVEFAALVTVDSSDGMTIDDVEILATTHDLYFPEIEPDWMNEPDYDYQRERD